MPQLYAVLCLSDDVQAYPYLSASRFAASSLRNVASRCISARCSAVSSGLRPITAPRPFNRLLDRPQYRDRRLCCAVEYVLRFG